MRPRFFVLVVAGYLLFALHEHFPARFELDFRLSAGFFKRRISNHQRNPPVRLLDNPGCVELRYGSQTIPNLFSVQSDVLYCRRLQTQFYFSRALLGTLADDDLFLACYFYHSCPGHFSIQKTPPSFRGCFIAIHVQMYFFTSIAKNYIPKARVLAKSLKKFHPDYKFGVVLCDELPKDFDLKNEPFDDLFLLKDLNLPVENLKQWIFKHTIVELCTAVKGQVFLKLFTEKYDDKIIYLDPDMVVLSDIGELSKLMDTHNIILTPHITEPEETKEAIIDNEILSGLLNGIYNLGFLAVKNNEEGMRFMKWWRDRLMDFCYDDVNSGLFTDQRWVDFAPVFFDGVHILKDKTYNVATWNIAQRKVISGQNSALSIDGEPMKIFHFSGFDSGAQEFMLKKYCKDKPLFDLREWYLNELIKNGQNTFGKELPAYALYSNKKIITKHQRFLYRNRDDLMEAFPDPFVNYIDWYEEKILLKNTPVNLEYFIQAIPNKKTSAELRECLAMRENIEAVNNFLGKISDQDMNFINSIIEIPNLKTTIESLRQDIVDIKQSISYRIGMYVTFVFRYFYELGKKHVK